MPVQIPLPRYVGQCGPRPEEAARIDEQGDEEGEDPDGADDDDVVELVVVEGLEDVVTRGDEEEAGQEDGEEGEGGGVEDAEEGDAEVEDVDVEAVHLFSFLFLAFPFSEPWMWNE